MSVLDYGPGVPLYEKDAADARERFQVQQRVAWHTTQGQVCLIDASADTGSRYQVLVTPVSEDAHRLLGGGVVISVIQPWQNCWYWYSLEFPPSEDWVAEKLGSPERKSRRVPMHGGDLAAITLAIAEAFKGGGFDDGSDD